MTLRGLPAALEKYEPARQSLVIRSDDAISRRECQTENQLAQTERRRQQAANSAAAEAR